MEGKLEAITRLAIMVFKKMKRAEVRADILEDELWGLMSEIPEKDMDEYVRITTEIDIDEDNKEQLILSRRHKKRY